MLKKCVALLSVELQHFKGKDLIYLDYMFDLLASLKSLDFSNFNTQITVDISYIFRWFYNLEY